MNLNLETASAEVIKKAGEVDNLRRRTEHATRQTEQRLVQQQNEHRQSTEKIAAERDALLRQLEHAKTNNAFEEHNRYEEQMRRPRRTVPARPKPVVPIVASPAGTPRKGQKNLALGDGFDDDDIFAISPSKRRELSRGGTPKHASKRKRQITDDSPVQILELSQPQDSPRSQQTPSFTGAAADVGGLRDFGKNDRRFDLLRRLLSLTSPKGEDRILEALAQYAFPSAPEKTLSSIVYDGLSFAAPSISVRNLGVNICRVFINIWTRCLREQYYEPMYIVLYALQFILASAGERAAIAVMDAIIPLIVDSVKLAAVPVYEARDHDKKASEARDDEARDHEARERERKKKALTYLFSPAYETIVSQIDVSTCLDLLYQLATSCVASPEPEPLSQFWRNMPLDFVLLTLLKEQPLEDMLLVLSTLSTSALETSLGPIVSDDPENQSHGEYNLITRLTNLFSETLAPISDPESSSPPPDPPEDLIWRVRLSVLTLLTTFSVPSYGSAALASHPLCIGRLIKYLNHAVSALYLRPLSPTQPLKIASINKTMHLLGHLARANPDVDIKSKLSDTLGGLHAYYVSLTRLAFSEGLVLEEGIEEDVSDMAHEILGDGVSIEEGEGLAEVFGSAGAS